MVIQKRTLRNRKKVNSKENTRRFVSETPTKRTKRCESNLRTLKHVLNAVNNYTIKNGSYV